MGKGRKNSGRANRARFTSSFEPELLRSRFSASAGMHVISDGLGCFRAVMRAGATHTPIVSAREPQQPEKIPALRWVNTVLGNLKTAIVPLQRAP
jgi:hypothetical protein